MDILKDAYLTPYKDDLSGAAPSVILCWTWLPIDLEEENVYRRPIFIVGILCLQCPFYFRVIGNDGQSQMGDVILQNLVM